MRVQQPPKPEAGGRADVRVARRLTLLTLAGAVMAAACGGGGGKSAAAPAGDAGAGTGATAGGTTAGGTTAAAPGGRIVNPTSLNPGGSLRRDTTGAPYDATAADSVERRVAAGATGETSPAVTGGASGMQLPDNVPVSQVGAGPTMTQHDGGGDRYAGGRYAAASAFIGQDGRAHYTDAAGRIMSDAEVRGRLARPASYDGAANGAMPSGAMIATGSVAAYQPNAPDAPGAAARNGSPVSSEPGTRSGAQTALNPAGAVDRNVAWGGASPEVAAKLMRGTLVAPVAPAISDSANPASPGGPVNPAVPNAALAPTGPNARAVLTLINSAEIEAARLAEQRASTPAIKQFAAELRRDHEAQQARLEQASQQARLGALSDAQRQAIGKALAEQRASLGNQQGGAPNFDTQWISAQVASHQQALTNLRALAQATPSGPLGAYIAQLTTGVQGHLQAAQRLQTRPTNAGTPARR